MRILGALGLALAALVAVGCPGNVVPPIITVVNTTTDEEVDDHINLPAGTTAATLQITADAAAGVNSLVVLQNDEHVALDVTRTYRQWTATHDFVFAATEETIILIVLDELLNETVKTIHVYQAPDIIDQIFLGGTQASQLQSRWANDPMQLLVSLNQGVVGTYDISVAVALRVGSSWVDQPALGFPYDEDHANPTFPATRGRYQYTIAATDAATGYQDSETFEVYVHDVATSDGFGGGTSPHMYDGSKVVNLDWGDLDAMVGAGLWSVELRANTPTLYQDETTGTNFNFRFDDIGPYRIRVGVRLAVTDPFTYTVDNVTSYVGTNDVPDQPTAGAATPVTLDSLSASSDYTTSGLGPITFTVSGTDTNMDDMTFVVGRGDLDQLSLIPTPGGGYSLSVAGATDPVTGSLTPATGTTATFVLSIPPHALDLLLGGGNPTPTGFTFTLEFWALDVFGSLSPDPPLSVTFTFAP